MNVLIITPWAGGFAGDQISLLRKDARLSVQVLVLTHVNGPKWFVLAMAAWQAMWWDGETPDVIHAYSAWPAGIAAHWIAKTSGVLIPVIIHEHIGPPNRLLGLPFAVRAMRDAKRLLSPSERHAKDLTIMVGRTFGVVPNPVVLGEKKRAVLCLGRFAREKGFGRVARISAMVPQAEFLLVADVNKSVARHMIETSDAVLCPSEYESFGLVAAEAALLGVPVVASDCGAHRDYATRLLPLTASDGDWAQAVRDVLGEPRGAWVMGSGGPQFMDNMVWNYQQAMGEEWGGERDGG